MKALVAFQITADIESMQGRSARIVNGTEIDTSFLTRSIDCYDASALELAIQLSEDLESCHCPFELEAITADNHPVESVLKNLYALRFGRVINAYKRDGAELSGAEVAGAICKAAKEEGADLLLFGCQSSIGNQGSLPYIVAETLGVHAFSEVMEAHVEEDGFLRLCCRTDDGSAEFAVRPPAVLLIGNAESAYLRYPTLKDKIKYKDKKVMRVPVEEGSSPPEFPPENGVRRTGLEIAGRPRAGKVVTGTARDAARLLVDEYLRKFYG